MSIHASRKIVAIEDKVHKGFYLIPGYDGFLVNKKGIVKSAKSGYEYKPILLIRGYYVTDVKRTNSLIVQKAYNHQLTCLAFYGPPPYSSKGVIMNNVNHINEKKLDNHYLNLEWATIAENVMYSIELKKKRNKSLDI